MPLDGTLWDLVVKEERAVYGSGHVCHSKSGNAEQRLF